MPDGGNPTCSCPASTLPKMMGGPFGQYVSNLLFYLCYCYELDRRELLSVKSVS